MALARGCGRGVRAGLAAWADVGGGRWQRTRRVERKGRRAMAVPRSTLCLEFWTSRDRRQYHILRFPTLPVQTRRVRWTDRGGSGRGPKGGSEGPGWGRGPSADRCGRPGAHPKVPPAPPSAAGLAAWDGSGSARAHVALGGRGRRRAGPTREGARAPKASAAVAPSERARAGRPLLVSAAGPARRWRRGRSSRAGGSRALQPGTGR